MDSCHIHLNFFL